MNKLLIVGNWKANPVSPDEAKNIASRVRRKASDLIRTEAVVCPPLPFIGLCRSKSKMTGYGLGAQDVSVFAEGSHTGQVSAGMLKGMGVEYVIVGHSEEREMGDTNQIISKKIATILENEMTPIVCVGEKERRDDGSHYGFVREQIKDSLVDIPKKYSREIVIAYEPVFAIGAQESMPSDQICEMALFIRKTYADIFGQAPALKMRVLYGGSVNFRNAYDIVSAGKVDGLLVGRESVNVVGFLELLKVVDRLN